MVLGLSWTALGVVVVVATRWTAAAGNLQPATRNDRLGLSTQGEVFGRPSKTSPPPALFRQREGNLGRRGGATAGESDQDGMGRDGMEMEDEVDRLDNRERVA